MNSTNEKNSPLRPVAWVLVATNHGSMLVNQHDYRLVDGAGYGVGYQLLNTSAFDQDEVNIAIALLRLRRQHFGDSVVALDCGANIGVHTIEWAKLMYGWGEVIGIEAQERVFYALAGNLSLNNCFNARAIWAAVGSNEGSIHVPYPDYFKPSSFGSLELRKRATSEFIGQEIDYSEQSTKVTKMISIDGLGLTRLDFIKIDIEGMEMEALIGGQNSILKFKPILIVETIKSNFDELYSFLSTKGYIIFKIGINLLGVHQSDPCLAFIKAA